MQLSELNQIGKREALADYITNIEAEATPVASMIPKGKRPNQGLVQFQVEKYREAGHKGVPEGQDAADFTSTPRALLFARRMRLWDLPSVTTESDENVIAGEPAGEMARQKRNSLVTLKRSLEKRLMCAYDGNIQSAGVGAAFRGLFKWQSSSNWTDLPATDTSVLMPAASKYSGAITAFTETALKAILASIYKVRKTKSSLDGFFGIGLKEAVSMFAAYTNDVSNMTATRHLNLDQADKEMITIVDRIVTDTAEINLHPHSFILTDDEDGLATDGSDYSGLILDMEMLELAYTKLPRIRDLEDRGGGPRAISEMMVSLVNKNPQGHGVILAGASGAPTLP